jgi:hypothetical protein
MALRYVGDFQLAIINSQFSISILMRRHFVQVSGFVLAGGISRVEFC